MKRMVASVGALAVLLAGVGGVAAEIGFSEDFALGTNRAAAVAQLIPGTEDYYYYTCLNYQNQGQYDKVEETLKLWLARSGENSRNWEIRNRQALLTYDKTPQATLDYLKRNLGLLFNHQQEKFGQKPTFATRLDPKVISRETLTARALADGRNTVSGFENTAFDLLAGMNLDGDRRRDLLRRLQRPAYPNLVRLVADDLDYQYAQPFGSYEIHRQMLLDQLDELLALKPNPLERGQFRQYLSRQTPARSGRGLGARRRAADGISGAPVGVRPESWGRRTIRSNSASSTSGWRTTAARANTTKRGSWSTSRSPAPPTYVNPKYLERAETARQPGPLRHGFLGGHPDAAGAG